MRRLIHFGKVMPRFNIISALAALCLLGISYYIWNNDGTKVLDERHKNIANKFQRHMLSKDENGKYFVTHLRRERLSKYSNNHTSEKVSRIPHRKYSDSGHVEQGRFPRRKDPHSRNEVLSHQPIMTREERILSTGYQHTSKDGPLGQESMATQDRSRSSQGKAQGQEERMPNHPSHGPKEGPLGQEYADSSKKDPLTKEKATRTDSRTPKRISRLSQMLPSKREAKMLKRQQQSNDGTQRSQVSHKDTHTTNVRKNLGLPQEREGTASTKQQHGSREGPLGQQMPHGTDSMSKPEAEGKRTPKSKSVLSQMGQPSRREVAMYKKQQYLGQNVKRDYVGIKKNSNMSRSTVPPTTKAPPENLKVTATTSKYKSTTPRPKTEDNAKKTASERRQAIQDKKQMMLSQHKNSVSKNDFQAVKQGENKRITPVKQGAISLKQSKTTPKLGGKQILTPKLSGSMSGIKSEKIDQLRNRQSGLDSNMHGKGKSFSPSALAYKNKNSDVEKTVSKSSGPNIHKSSISDIKKSNAPDFNVHNPRSAIKYQRKNINKEQMLKQ